MNNLKHFTFKFFGDFAIILLGIFIANLYYVISVYTIHWIILLFFGPVFFMKYKGFSFENIGTIFLILIIIGAVATGIITFGGSFLPFDPDWTILPKEYEAIGGLEEIWVSTRDSYDNIQTIIYPEYVYPKNYAVDSLILDIEAKYEDFYTRSYIFWQSAVSKGYQVKYIHHWEGSGSIAYKITFYIVVGLFSIIETFINAISETIIISVILFIYSILGKWPSLFEFLKPILQKMRVKNLSSRIK